MEDDAFEQVAEREIVVVGERLQRLQQALFEAHAGLDAFDEHGFPAGQAPARHW
jgi:hypothetical protein